jgi:single-strand DNA-binding protein
MFNEAHISFTGYVAKQPETRTVKVDGAEVPSLRLRVGWTERRYDRVLGEWVDGVTSYVTVNCWRKLAMNAGVCIRKGDPVLVKGKVSVRTYTGKDGLPHKEVEVEASSVGHDLTLGVSGFQRVRPKTGMSASEFAASHAGVGEAGASEQNGAGDRAAFAAAAALPGSLDGPEEPDDPFFDDAAIADVADEADEAAQPDEPDEAEAEAPPAPARGRRGARQGAAANGAPADAVTQADQVAVPF